MRTWHIPPSIPLRSLTDTLATLLVTDVPDRLRQRLPGHRRPEIRPGGDRGRRDSRQEHIGPGRPRDGRARPAGRGGGLTGTLAADEQVVLGHEGRRAARRDHRRPRQPASSGASRSRASTRPTSSIRVDQAEAALQQARARLGLPADGDDDRVDPEQTALVRQAQRGARRGAAHPRPAGAGSGSSSSSRAPSSTPPRPPSRWPRAATRTRSRRSSNRQGAARPAALRARARAPAARRHRAPLADRRRGRERQASVGEYLAAGAPVVTLVRIHPLRLRLAVPEREARRACAPGQRCASPSRATRRVYRGPRGAPVARRSHEQNRTLLVEAEVPNERRPRCGRAPSPRPRSSSEADQPVVTVPADGARHVRRRREGARGPGRQERRSCASTTGRRLGDRVEIVDGLQPASRSSIQPGNLTGGQAGHASSRSASVQKLAEVCIRRPVFAAMIVLALVVVGAASYFRLGVDRFPSVDLPTVSVRTELPGASAEEMETQVSQTDRGGGQHRRGHQRAALDLRPGQLASSSSPSS